MVKHIQKTLRCLLFAMWVAACSRGEVTSNDGKRFGQATVDSAVTGAQGGDGASKGSADSTGPAASRDASAKKDADAHKERDGAKKPGAAGNASGDEDAGTTGASLDAGADLEEARLFVYVGGWDWNASTYPFRAFELRVPSGTWAPIGDPIDLGPNPSFIAVAPDQRTLYVTNENDDAAGGITVAAIDPVSGALQRVDHEPAVNGGFVFASVDPSGRYVLASSYNGGSVSVFPIEAGGALGTVAATQVFATGAKSHSIVVPAAGGFAFVANLDLDSIAQLTFDQADGRLADNPAGGSYAAAAGSGPRTLAAPTDPASRYLYVSHERASTVAALSVDSNGTLTELETKSTLPDGFTGENTAAHLRVHPNGRFLYASNRGHDSIAVFEIAKKGTLTLLQHVSTRGTTPRHFDIDAQGAWLVVANQDSGSLAAFAIGRDGRLQPVGEPLTGLASPTSVALITPQ